MKDQYFGDQTDYIKYGILRAFANAGARLGIHWTLTGNDRSSDGSRIRYLNAANRWRSYDPQVFDALAERIRIGDRRLRLVEELGFIPGAIHSFDKWENSAETRKQSVQNLLNRLPDRSIVFLDPDNGLEVASITKNAPGASKYVFLDEIEAFWLAGHSVVIYQHYPRVPRIPYVQQQLARLRTALPEMTGAALLTSRVAFLVGMQPEHCEVGSAAVSQIVKQWSPHVDALHIV